MDIDSLFSEEELMVRQTVRDFVDEEVIPIIEEANRKEEMPLHLIPKMAEMGLFGATIKEYDLPGLNHVAYGLIMQELERGDSGIRSFASVQSGLVMYPINTYGSKEQRDYWIPKLASGEKIGCFGLTEPDFGSNPGGMRTNARRDGNSWVLNGAKAWITNGLKYPLSCLTQARYGIAWGAIGSAMATYSTAVEYAKSRIQFGGQPIASHQLVQNKLAWMITEITKAQMLALQMGRLKDQGKLKPHHVSMGKMNNVNIALECARSARDILGANGISDEYPIIRHMLNLESVKTYEGTHDIHNLIIGEAVTGIAAYNPPMSAKDEKDATARREAEAMAK